MPTEDRACVSCTCRLLDSVVCWNLQSCCFDAEHEDAFMSMVALLRYQLVPVSVLDILQGSASARSSHRRLPGSIRCVFGCLHVRVRR